MNTEIPVSRIKNTKIIKVHPDDTMMKVEEIFDNFNIHHILVLDENKLVGIISQSDVLKIYKNKANKGVVPMRNEVLAKDIMTTDPIVLDNEDTIGLAADIILANKIHSLPIMEGNRLCGIITNHDLIKYCFK
jgi:CBS domain-containing protein